MVDNISSGWSPFTIPRQWGDEMILLSTHGMTIHGGYYFRGHLSINTLPPSWPSFTNTRRMQFITIIIIGIRSLKGSDLHSTISLNNPSKSA
jgi:hypothetical protein